MGSGHAEGQETPEASTEEKGQEIDPSWIIRHANLGNGERDEAPISSSWRNGYWDGWAHNKGIARKLYSEEHANVMRKIILRPRTVTLVACNPDDDKHLFGWACAEVSAGTSDLVLHFVYTFEAFRKYGVATALIKRFIEDSKPQAIIASHRTVASKRLEPKLSIVYNPYRKYR